MNRMYARCARVCFCVLRCCCHRMRVSLLKCVRGLLVDVMVCLWQPGDQAHFKIDQRDSFWRPHFLSSFRVVNSCFFLCCRVFAEHIQCVRCLPAADSCGHVSRHSHQAHWMDVVLHTLCAIRSRAVEPFECHPDRMLDFVFSVLRPHLMNDGCSAHCRSRTDTHLFGLSVN